MGRDEDVWQKSRGRDRIDCGTDGCDGMCPRYVIMAGLKPKGKRARCRTCEVVFQLPQPKGRNPRGGGNGSKPTCGGADGKDKKIQELQRQLAEATKVASKTGSEAATDITMEVEEPDDPVLAEINVMVQVLKDYKSAAPSTQKVWANIHGDEAQQQKAIDSKRSARRANLPPSARQRGTRDRLRKAEASLKSVQAEGTTLQAELASVQEKIALLATRTATVEEQVKTLRQEDADIASALAREKAEAAGVQAPRPDHVQPGGFVALPTDSLLLDSLLQVITQPQFTALASSEGVSDSVGLAVVQEFAGRVRAACGAKKTPNLAPAAEAAAAPPVQTAPAGQPAAAAAADAADVPVEPIDPNVSWGAADIDECMAEASLDPAIQEQLKNLLIKRRRKQQWTGTLDNT